MTTLWLHESMAAAGDHGFAPQLARWRVASSDEAAAAGLVMQELLAEKAANFCPEAHTDCESRC